MRRRPGGCFLGKLRRCWASQSRATRGLDGRRGGPGARPRLDRRRLHSARGVARQPASSPGLPEAGACGCAATANADAGARWTRAPNHRRPVEGAAVRGFGARRSLRQPARPGRLSLLDPRILAEHDEVRERRRQLRRPVYQKPELLAESPNQVWSWDITKLMGPAKWRYFYLYVIIDIFSRRIVAWQIADAESAALFKPLFDDAAVKHDVAPGQLTLHADRGGPMKAKATALLLADLGVTKSHSRPYTSNDNPFSESHCAPASNRGSSSQLQLISRVPCVGRRADRQRRSDHRPRSAAEDQLPRHRCRPA